MSIFDNPQLTRIEALVRFNIRLSQAILNKEAEIMSDYDDIQAAEQKALDEINANTGLIPSIKAVVDAQTAKITDLTNQLTAAQSAAPDQATKDAIQAILDKANAIVAATDSQALALAAVNGTPAQQPSGTDQAGSGPTT